MTEDFAYRAYWSLDENKMTVQTEKGPTQQFW